MTISLPQLGQGKLATLVIIMALIGLNTLVAMVKALATGTWDWSKVGNWTISYLKHIGAALLAAVLAQSQPSLANVLNPAFYAVAGSIVVQWLLGNLRSQFGGNTAPPALPATKTKVAT